MSLVQVQKGESIDKRGAGGTIHTFLFQYFPQHRISTSPAPAMSQHLLHRRSAGSWTAAVWTMEETDSKIQLE